MIAIFDVDYKEDKANIACVVATDWEAKEPAKLYTKVIAPIAEYESGAFYKRELPCLLGIIADITEFIDFYVIDGYVWLGEKPGLGYHLYQATNGKIPVIGVAKTSFHNNFNAMEVQRGQSNNPLFITSIGIDLQESSELIKNMHGEYRLPHLLKLTDTLCRQWKTTD
jgi:deoxyribonuclease V